MRSTTAIASAALVAALGMAPGVALADDQTDAADTELDAPVTETCQDALLTVSPSRVTGDEDAVTIEAQALDVESDGWLHVSWRADDGTRLSEIVVTDHLGTWILTDDLDHGTLEDVRELTFCGTRVDETVAEQPADDDASAPTVDDTQVRVQPELEPAPSDPGATTPQAPETSTPESGTTPPTTPETSTPETSTPETSTPESDPPEPTTETTTSPRDTTEAVDDAADADPSDTASRELEPVGQPLDIRVVDVPDPASGPNPTNEPLALGDADGQDEARADDPGEGDELETTDRADTEVLGVSLSRDDGDDEVGTGWIIVLGALLLAGVGSGVGWLRGQPGGLKEGRRG